MLPVLMEAELRAAELRPAAEVLDDFWLSIWFWRCCCICCCTVLGEWPTGTVTGITLGGALLNGVYNTITKGLHLYSMNYKDLVVNGTGQCNSNLIIQTFDYLL